MPNLQIVSRWHHSAEGLSTSTLSFYDDIEKAIVAKELPVRIQRITRAEAGILSGSRQYLEITYSRYAFHVSAFPFGKDFYFGWWLGKVAPGLAGLGCAIIAGVPIALIGSVLVAGFAAGLLLFFLLAAGAAMALSSGAIDGAVELQESLSSLPWIGPVYRKLFNPVTYFSEESRTIFEESVHRAVLDVVAGVLVVAKMSPLTDAQKAAHAATDD